MYHNPSRAALILLLILTPMAQAGTWQLSTMTQSSRSPFVGAQRETNLLPSIDYIGERFSFTGGEIHYSVASGKLSDSYLLGRVRQRQFYSPSLDPNAELELDGMQDRDSAFELGFGHGHQASWGRYELEGSADVSRAHRGYQLTARYSYPKPIGRWLVVPGIALQMQSDDLVDYYHGVRAAEAREGRPAYVGDRAINTLATLVLGYSISSDWQAVIGLEQLWLDDSIKDSPIVSEAVVEKVYAGLIHTF